MNKLAYETYEKETVSKMIAIAIGDRKTTNRDLRSHFKWRSRSRSRSQIWSRSRSRSQFSRSGSCRGRAWNKRSPTFIRDIRVFERGNHGFYLNYFINIFKITGLKIMIIKLVLFQKNLVFNCKWVSIGLIICYSFQFWLANPWLIWICKYFFIGYTIPFKIEHPVHNIRI